MRSNLVLTYFSKAPGQPYSYTFGGDRDTLAGYLGNRETLRDVIECYFSLPKGDGSDVILDGIDEGEFNAFLEKSGLSKYRGRIAPRNALQAIGWTGSI